LRFVLVLFSFFIFQPEFIENSIKKGRKKKNLDKRFENDCGIAIDRIDIVDKKKRAVWKGIR